MKIYRNNRGSLTVEAAMILPLFLCFFFLLLFLIKTACIHITLDHAVRETAKEIAASAYPISFLNELEDEMAEEQNQKPVTLNTGLERIRYDHISQASTDFIARLVSGQIKKTNLEGVLEDVAAEIIPDSKTGVRNYLFTSCSQIFYNLKDKGKYYAVKTIVDKHLAGSFVEPEHLIFSLVEFPQSSKEYDLKKNNQAYQQVGLLPGKDFGKDDVVIQIDYELEIPLPLFNDIKITLTHTAVERAWLSGGNGVYTDRADKSVFESEQQLVYITRTGKKFHKSDCRYLKKSRIPIFLDYAKIGYDPCKVCKPLE